MGAGETMGQVIVIKRENPDALFEVRRDNLHAQGATLGAALDRLLDQIGETNEPLVLVRQGHPDRFFTQQDFDRIHALMARKKGQGEPLSPEEDDELETLIDKEILATTLRAQPPAQQAA
jgi:hypothetical protein